MTIENTTTDNQLNLARAAEVALSYAKKSGMDQCDVSLHQGTGISVTAREQRLETVEKHNDAQLAVSVYKNNCMGSASSADLSDVGIQQTVDAAMSIARFTGQDDCLGLADAERMAGDLRDLDLYHPWELAIPELLDQAMACEAAALHHDKKISNTEGASISSYSGVAVYANSHGFLSQQAGSQHSLSCSVIAADDGGMQRDYWYDSNRNAAKLMSAEQLGVTAAQRTLRRLGSKHIGSLQAPVLFDPMTAKSLLGHLISALKGGAIYKRASFLVDQVGESILPPFFTVSENPHIPGASGSAMHDSEGVATPERRAIVENGVLQSYVLSSYSARKLGLKSTANAGGVRNLHLNSTGQSFDELLSELGTGLLVTELIGSAVNLVTGDYSRGAAGFWVKNGEIQHPVEEITIAGNLRDIFRKIVATGRDLDTRGNTVCGSILVENMTIAGQ